MPADLFPGDERRNGRTPRSQSNPFTPLDYLVSAHEGRIGNNIPDLTSTVHSPVSGPLGGTNGPGSRETGAIAIPWKANERHAHLSLIQSEVVEHHPQMPTPPKRHMLATIG